VVVADGVASCSDSLGCVLLVVFVVFALLNFFFCFFFCVVPYRSHRRSFPFYPEQLRVMEKGCAHLEARIKKCHMDAVKKSKAKNKRGAMLDLKRKKLLEKQLTQKQNQSFNLENQLFALENANSNKQMLDTMKVTNGAMGAVMNSV
jgi:hypothetical protein